MLYVFHAGTHVTQLKVDKDRNLEIATEVTKFIFVPLSNLLNQEQVKKLEDHTENMNDKDFDQYLIQEFQKLGYILKEKM